MNIKKIMMIVLLVIVIGCICFAFVKVNEKSKEKSSSETASKEADAKESQVIEITDNFFIEQTNDIYINLEDYVGKTVKMEGLIYSYEDENGDILYAVVRNTPGCCGNDGLAGLDIRYDKDYPKEDTWVEVVGVVESETVNGSELPALKVSSMIEKEKGTEFVTN